MIYDSQKEGFEYRIPKRKHSKYYPDKVNEYPYIELLNLYCARKEGVLPILNDLNESNDAIWIKLVDENRKLSIAISGRFIYKFGQERNRDFIS